MSSSLQDECDSPFSDLGFVGATYLKFISLFQTDEYEDETMSISFGKHIEDSEVDVDLAKNIRTWLKEQKRWIRDVGKKASPDLCIRRMWFIVSKCIEQGIFTTAEQGNIIRYMNSCVVIIKDD